MAESANPQPRIPLPDPPDPRFAHIERTLKARRQGADAEFRRGCQEIGIDPDDLHLLPGDSRVSLLKPLLAARIDAFEKAAKEYVEAANKIVNDARQEEWHRQLIVAITGNAAHQAHRQKLFPKDIPNDPDLVDAIVLLDSARTSRKTNREILREFTGEPADNCPKAKKLESRIRKARSVGRTSLPPRRERTKRTQC